MTKDFVEELTWRGMVHDVMPETDKHLMEQMRSAYVGIDPTADSLHIGHLVGVMMLRHFQLAGHKPVALVGGATGMIGDPSGKSAERNLLDEKTLRHNQEALKGQLSRFLDFESDADNAAVLVNNYDWMKDFSFLDFIRDVGKHITVNYMMSKDSVKKRLSSDAKEGMSFTEFTYQMVQGYDFLHLFKTHNCTLQMGGSDQWGNITTGTELIRRIGGGKGYALTCPLITKADGTKFGKTEGGNIWLDAERTSPYKFYQYWLNTSDEDAEKYIKIFTFLSKEDISTLVDNHKKEPHLRNLQKKLAEEVTKMVHSQEDLDNAVKASSILFGKSTSEDLKQLNEKTFLDVFDGVPQADVEIAELDAGLDMIGALAAKTNFLSSNGEARRELKQNSISVNKEKVKEDYLIKKEDLINDKYVLLQKGKTKLFYFSFQLKSNVYISKSSIYKSIKMKKTLILLLIFGFVSCTNSDNNETQELNNALIGEWSLTNVSCFCGFPDPPNFDLTTVTFSDTVSELTVLNSGNEVYFRENGTYSYTSTDTSITMENGQAFDVELNGNRLLLIFVDSPAIADDEVTYSFTRNE